MEISSDIRERITQAAEQLYEESGRERFPPIDQVRRLARVGMNDASAVMKEWRRQQTAAPKTIAVTVPDRIKEVFHSALAEAWQEAEGLANESLTAAQQAWEIERAEADSLRRELSEAHENQSEILEGVQGELRSSEEVAEELRGTNEALAADLAEAKAEIRDLQSRLVHAEVLDKDKAARIEELKSELVSERQHAELAQERYDIDISKLRDKLEYTHDELVRTKALLEAEARSSEERQEAILKQCKQTEAREGVVRQELEAAHTQHASELAKAEATTLKEREKYASALKKAEGIAQEARERAATVHGRLEAAIEQNRQLITALGLQAKPSPGSKK